MALPKFREITDGLVAALTQWRQSADSPSATPGPTKLAVMLEHRYTRDGLFDGKLTAAAQRAFASMMTMKKIDIAAIEAARRG